MMATITQLPQQNNIPQKKYFGNVQNGRKIAFLEKQNSNWEETLDYLHIYWNANNIEGIRNHLSKKLRIKHFGSIEKVMETSVNISSVLLQKKELLCYEELVKKEPDSIIKLTFLDRKMFKWNIIVYAKIEKGEEGCIIKEYHLLDIQRQDIAAEQKTNEYFISTFSLNKSIAERATELTIKNLTYHKEEDGYSEYLSRNRDLKIVASENKVICMAATKKQLRSLMWQVIGVLQIENMRINIGEKCIKVQEI